MQTDEFTALSREFVKRNKLTVKNDEPGCLDKGEKLLFYKTTTARHAILHLKVLSLCDDDGLR